jgi:hypothetical protein
MRKFTPRNFHRSGPVTTKLHQVHHRVEGVAKAANGEKVASATPLGSAGALQGERIVQPTHEEARSIHPCRPISQATIRTMGSSALKAEIDETASAELNSTISRPLPKPKRRSICVKVINHFGDEVQKVFFV